MLCLFVHISGFPFKNHVYAVLGIPYAIQGKVTVVFDPAVVSCGFKIHSGLAIGKIITLSVTQEDPLSKRSAFQSNKQQQQQQQQQQQCCSVTMKREVVLFLFQDAGCTTPLSDCPEQVEIRIGQVRAFHAKGKYVEQTREIERNLACLKPWPNGLASSRKLNLRGDLLWLGKRTPKYSQVAKMHFNATGYGSSPTRLI